MEAVEFLSLTADNVLLLLGVGFVGGLVSGFIGSGGAFVLTPAMMSLGVPGIVAVASNMAHKFPKALVAAVKRARYGQVDLKLGLIMGLFAEAGVFTGKELMTAIRRAFGDTGTDLYVSAVFVAILATVGVMVLRDAWRECHGKSHTAQITRLALWVRTLRIPGTMVRLRSIDASVSVLVIAPLGFATGLLAASIAVGGFIGVPAMMYVLGVPAIMATATELVVAFVMGLGGTLFYALDGFVDIRLSMIILAASLFGVQLGAIGTTYVRDYVIKFVMGWIMTIVLLSRLAKVPVYLADLGLIEPLAEGTVRLLNALSFNTLAAALLSGGGLILAIVVRALFAERRSASGY